MEAPVSRPARDDGREVRRVELGRAPEDEGLDDVLEQGRDVAVLHRLQDGGRRAVLEPRDEAAGAEELGGDGERVVAERAARVDPEARELVRGRPEPGSSKGSR